MGDILITLKQHLKPHLQQHLEWLKVGVKKTRFDKQQQT